MEVVCTSENMAYRQNTERRISLCISYKTVHTTSHTDIIALDLGTIIIFIKYKSCIELIIMNLSPAYSLVPLQFHTLF